MQNKFTEPTKKNQNQLGRIKVLSKKKREINQSGL